MLWKNPGFTLVVVAALALGIGTNTAVFTLVNGVLFKGLPFEDGHRIMFLAGNNLPKGQERTGVSYPDFRDWRAQSKTLEALAAFDGLTANLSDKGNPPERYAGTRMTANAFSVIGQKPVLGRDFSAEDEKPGAPAVMIIGHGLWKDRYGANPKVLGLTVRVNETPTEIIGVMAEGMKFPFRNDLWIPLAVSADLEKRDQRNLSVYGKLARNAELADARAEMDIIAKRLEKEYAATNTGAGVILKPYNDEFNGGQIRIMFLALLGAVGCVLLVACANVANLLLSRSIGRMREVSIRAALGAGRWRIVRQLLIESVLMSILGGIAGLLLAIFGVRAFDLAVANVGKPYWIDFSMDYFVFAYFAAVCIGTGLLFGLAPALQSARVDLNETLKEGSRGSGRGSRARLFSSVLVVTEIALSLVLLAGAGLMIRSFLNLQGMQSVPSPASIQTMRLMLVDAKYPKKEDRIAFYDKLRRGLGAVPGVESVAFVSNLPVGGSMGSRFEIEGQPKPENGNYPSVSSIVTSPDYFRAARMPLIRGRAFHDKDGLPGGEVAIVNQRFATKHWPGQDPVGKRLRLIREGVAAQPWLNVIGIAPDIRQNNPSRPELDPVVYIPYPQDPLRNPTIMARVNVAASSVVTAFRKEVQNVDPDLPVYQVQTLEEFNHQQRWPFRVFGTLFAVFSLIAVVLASVGIYAVMAYSVSQRTQEIGVHLAMGATAATVMRLVMSRGLWQLGLGLAIGLAGALGITRVLSGLLVGVTATDPATFVLITVVLMSTSVAACLIPARRAMKVDPVVALRYE